MSLCRVELAWNSVPNMAANTRIPAVYTQQCHATGIHNNNLTTIQTTVMGEAVQKLSKLCTPPTTQTY